MEKLIKLLNEWSKTAIENKCNWTDVYDEDGVYFVNLFDRDMTMEVEEIISKKIGFIKWLVENEKIDRERVSEKNKNGYDITRVNPDDNYIDSMENYDDEADLYLIMLLSIQDEPIEFLVSILK